MAPKRFALSRRNACLLVSHSLDDIKSRTCLHASTSYVAVDLRSEGPWGLTPRSGLDARGGLAKRADEREARRNERWRIHGHGLRGVRPIYYSNNKSV